MPETKPKKKYRKNPANVLEVECLACKEPPGQPCSRESRAGDRVSLLRPHWQRYIAANLTEKVFREMGVA